jgi:hypothetical protein
MKSKNTLKQIMDDHSISNKLAAKLLNIKKSTIASMRSKRFAILTRQKTIDKHAYDLLCKYIDYLQEQLEIAEKVLLTLKKDKT